MKKIIDANDELETIPSESKQEKIIKENQNDLINKNVEEREYISVEESNQKEQERKGLYIFGLIFFSISVALIFVYFIMLGYVLHSLNVTINNASSIALQIAIAVPIVFLTMAYIIIPEILFNILSIIMFKLSQRSINEKISNMSYAFYVVSLILFIVFLISSISIPVIYYIS